MGNLEVRSTKKARRKNVTSFVLASVKLAGVVGIAMLAPNVLGAMHKLGIMPNPRQKESINRARDRLIQQGLLKRERGFLRLTERGERAVRLIREGTLPQPKRKWDKRWRVLIFDIPDYRKGLRDKLRRTLTGIGFVRLQDSVWVYPYDCDDLIALLKADFRIGKGMLYMIVEELEGDKDLRQQFGLH